MQPHSKAYMSNLGLDAAYVHMRQWLRFTATVYLQQTTMVQSAAHQHTWSGRECQPCSWQASARVGVNPVLQASLDPTGPHPQWSAPPPAFFHPVVWSA